MCVTVWRSWAPRANYGMQRGSSRSRMGKRRPTSCATARAYFAETFLGKKMKLRILCEKLLIISQRFFGIPPFRFYALADGIKAILSQTCPGVPQPSLPNLQLELLLGWQGPKI